MFPRPLVFLLAAAAPLFAQALDEARRTTLPHHVPSQATAAADRGPLAPDTPLEAVTLLLQPTAAQQADLAILLANQQNPSSPDYHRWLTPDQFGARFGVSAANLAPLNAWFQQHHLHIDELARGRNWLTLSGTAAQFQSAFHTNLHRFDVHGRTHFANVTVPSIPDSFRNLVTGFRGLHDFPLPAPHPNYNSSTGRHLLGPDDFAILYDLVPLYAAGIDGSEQKIVIVGQSTINPSDISTFRSTFLLPVNTPQLVLTGPSPGKVPDAEIEADLDLEWSGAIARNATLIYVYARDVFAAAQAAVNQNLAPVISMSYGACEPQWPTAFADRLLAQQANAQGITWVASSGDSGAAGCEAQASSPQATHGLAVQVPASIPEVTAIGGTQFDDSNDDYWNLNNSATGASVKSYIPEIAWNESGPGGLASGGGGASLLFPKPAWQTAPGVPNDHARNVPDISFNAALYTGYYIISGGNPYRVGGTSAGTPAFAGILALLNQYQVLHNSNAPQPGLGNINPALYRLAQTTPSVFHDVTNGNNMVPCQQATPGCSTGQYGYLAGVGYDLATGLGSLDVNNFFTRWNTAQTQTTTTLSATATTVAANATIQLTAQIAPVAATGTVTFLSSSTTLGTATPGTPFTLQASALKLGANTITALYSGDNLYAGSSAILAITVNLPASGAAIVPSVSNNPVLQDFFSGAWTANLKLTEIAGVGATLTGFTVDGSPLGANLFNSSSIAAKGNIQAHVTLTGLTIPVTKIFSFTGTDATGLKWTQSLPVTFLGPSISAPILINSANGNTVYEDLAADASCQWRQRIVIQELSGYAFNLTALILGGIDQSNLIARYFGTTHLAPYGLLQGDVCWPFPVPGAFLTLLLGGSGEQGDSGLAGIETTLAGPPQNAVSLSVSPGPPWQVNVPPGTSWTATILPANPTTGWLTISPQSGTGPATITPQVNALNLPHGAYNATIVVTASGTAPQYVEVPFGFVNGGAPSISIGGATNGASFQPAYAPNMILSVFGKGLAPSVGLAPSIPLPLTLNGVSATVNNIAAPLFYVSPTQVNLQIPDNTSAGLAYVGINNNGSVAGSFINVSPVAPGIFATLSTARAGDTLALFLTGAGDPDANAPIAITVAGQPASETYIGIPPGLAGATQVNFTVPPNTPAGPQPVAAIVGGVTSPPITLLIQP